MFKSVKSKLIVPIIGIVALLVTAVAVFFSVVTISRTNAFAEERMAAATHAARSYLAAHERQTQVAAVALGSSGELARLIQAGVNEDIWQYLFDRKEFLGVDEIIVANHEGIALARSHVRDSHGDIIRGVPSIAAGLRGDILSFYTPTPTAPMVMTTAAPIFYGAPTPGAVVVSSIVGSHEFLDRISDAFAVDAMVFVGDTSVSSTIIDPETGQRVTAFTADPDIVASVLRAGQHASLQADLFGAPYHAYFFPLLGAVGTPVGMFFIGISQELAVATVNAAMLNTAIASVSAILVVILVMFLLVSRVLKPIGLLTQTLDDTAEGDLTKRLPESGRDEIARASRSFNKTMEELRKMIAAVKSQAGKLSDIGDDLAGNMAQTASAMNEITANIQSIKGMALNQSAGVSQTNATMGQVSSNIDRLSGNAERQTGAVSLASVELERVISNIKAVGDTLAKNAESMEALKDSSQAGKSGLHEVAADIREIVRESEGLLNINAVIENIASQTNLLSMNAAIEAARAGEAGKGFAVVSGEIRKLAESSSEQSRIIGEVLKKIMESMDKITLSTDNVMNRFEAIDLGVNTVANQEEIIRSAMNEQSDGGRRAMQAAGQVAEITQQVTGDAREMQEGSKEVIRESQNLERATQEITDGINEMAAGAEQVNRAVNAVSDLSDKTKENIAALAQSVAQFRV